MCCSRLQAAIGQKIVASTSISPIRKDVLAKCYGSDISRKKKMTKCWTLLRISCAKCVTRDFCTNKILSSFVEFLGKFLRVSKVTMQPLYDSKLQNICFNRNWPTYKPTFFP